MIVSGPAFIWRRSASQSAVRSFDEAFALVRSDLSLQAECNPVFAAHLEMLDDPMLRDAVQDTMLEMAADGIPDLRLQVRPVVRFGDDGGF